MKSWGNGISMEPRPDAVLPRNTRGIARESVSPALMTSLEADNRVASDDNEHAIGVADLEAAK